MLSAQCSRGPQDTACPVDSWIPSTPVGGKRLRKTEAVTSPGWPGPAPLGQNPASENEALSLCPGVRREQGPSPEALPQGWEPLAGEGSGPTSGCTVPAHPGGYDCLVNHTSPATHPFKSRSSHLGFLSMLVLLYHQTIMKTTQSQLPSQIKARLGLKG